ncbi:branched-chain amino acid ABC transporter permease [Actinomadura geliboluensis]|uniref:branched-chain amino acid ABC transporter permease n=1 Tax=Actinomadura geliboluensis TaxID=882440 RepID=UPI002624E4F4|nr:branched-chain amino acid ABC transporter permease [Actinomadura geliboluensis]
MPALKEALPRVPSHPLAFPLLAVTLLAATGTLGGPGLQRTVIECMVLMLVVVSLHLFSGTSGVVSVCHVAFVQLGAYISALVTMDARRRSVMLPDMPRVLADVHVGLPVSMLLACAVCAVVAAVTGPLLMRLNGLQSAIATFSLLLIVDNVVMNWGAVTGGPSALIGVTESTTVLQVWLALVAAAVLCHGFARSNAGLRLRTSREDEVAARALGINVPRERLKAFVLSAVIAGLAGALFGHRLSTLNPEDFGLKMTFFVLAMLIIGGMRSLSGAVLGALVVTLLTEVLLRFEGGVEIGRYVVTGPAGLRELGLAAVLIVILIRRPEGITRGRDIVPPRWRAARARPVRPVARQGSADPEPLDEGAQVR